MPRYKVTLEYDGRGFSGWQRQANVVSVQEVVEVALQRLDPNMRHVIAAGRTDAGVHATGQVIHFDLAKQMETHKLQDAMNFHMRPYCVSAVSACRVADDFHARFHAVRRSYLYRILCRRSPAPLLNGHVWRLSYPLDLDTMQAACVYLVGRHDFTTFRASQCQANSPIRSVESIELEQVGAEIHMRVQARSFLHSQIRSFMGTLERVGAGRWKPEQVKDALEARDRKACGPVAPPWGLYLTKVYYENMRIN